jgi:hypothetical protein
MGSRPHRAAVRSVCTTVVVCVRARARVCVCACACVCAHQMERMVSHKLIVCQHISLMESWSHGVMESWSHGCDAMRSTRTLQHVVYLLLRQCRVVLYRLLMLRLLQQHRCCCRQHRLGKIHSLELPGDTLSPGSTCRLLPSPSYSSVPPMASRQWHSQLNCITA